MRSGARRREGKEAAGALKLWNLIIVFISLTESFNERHKNYECFRFMEES